MEQLVSRSGTPDDIVAYDCDENGEIIKLPKKEYAHDSTQYYSIVTSGSKPYVALSVNSFGAIALGVQNTVTQEVNEMLSVSIGNWVYGEEARQPVSTVKYGVVKYAYAKKGETLFSPNVPTNAGTYYLKAYVEPEEEYTGVEEIIEFTIEKATYDLRVAFNSQTFFYDGEEHALEIQGNLPDGIRIVYERNVGPDAGEYDAVVHFYGDSENYNLIPDKKATLTIEEKSTWIFKKYWWAFALAFGFVNLVFLGFLVRLKEKFIG